MQAENSSRLDARIGDWLRKVLNNEPLTDTSSPDAPILRPATDDRVVLAVTHEDCLLAVRRILFRSDEANPPLQVEIAPHVKITDPLGNCTSVIIRFWREDAGDRVKARIEAWGCEASELAADALQ